MWVSVTVSHNNPCFKTLNLIQGYFKDDTEEIIDSHVSDDEIVKKYSGKK